MNAIECAMEGRIGKVSELRTSQAGKPWASVSLAIGEDGSDGVQWVSVAVFGSQAESVAALKPGARLYVEGRLKLDTWQDREGSGRTGLKVTAWLAQPIALIGHRKPAKAKDGDGKGNPPHRSEAVSRPLEGLQRASAAQREVAYPDAEIPF